MFCADTTVEILLSTYNGSAYLEDFLESIQCQTFQNYKLIVRDDGSRDNTMSILESYQKRFGERMKIVCDDGGNLGVVRSFSRLLKNTAADYVLFADQDDVWVSRKIEVLLDEMLRLEKINPTVPVLVHSDLAVVDEGLSPLSASFWRYQALNPHACQLSRLLVQNSVTGCATMINRSLAEKIRDLPVGAIMHDWWAALVAAEFGVIGIVDESLVKYRQHGGNCVGAKRYSVIYIFRALLNAVVAAGGASFREGLVLTRRQAQAFLEMFGDSIKKDSRELLDGYANINNMRWLERRLFILKKGLLRQGLVRNIGMFLRV